MDETLLKLTTVYHATIGLMPLVVARLF